MVVDSVSASRSDCPKVRFLGPFASFGGVAMLFLSMG
jgi:hypothetical protein